MNTSSTESQRVGALHHPGPAAPLRIRGTLVSRFPLIDGRPADAPWMVAEIVAAFEPGTIPLLSRHTSAGGFPIGHVDELTATSDGRDLLFSGEVSYPDPDLIAQLRKGVGSSGDFVPPYGIRIPGQVSGYVSYFTGRRTGTWQLVGIAIVTPPERPAAAGSRMVADG